MTNECPRCGAYMVDPSTPDRCDKCEIARLRQENADLLETVKSYQKGVVEQVEREQRLREVIQREAEKHEVTLYRPCDCEICEIAREEP